MRIYGNVDILDAKEFSYFIYKNGYVKFAEYEHESMYVNEAASIIKVCANNAKYIVVEVSKNEPQREKKYAKYINVFGKNRRICVIVAQTFLTKPNDGFYEVTHINKNLCDDSVKNLMYILRAERIHRGWQTKTSEKAQL